MQDSRTRFGGPVSAVLDGHLTAAARNYTDKPRAEALLLEAQERDPHCLPVYFSLYKFYFHSRRLADAERVVLAALEAAARQAGINPDWSSLSAGSAAWQDTTGPAHFYLFSLKALAFIRLRLGRRPEAVDLLEKLAELDGADSVGGSVIRSLEAATG
jgi:tetratricopeptide (TPR) repeat protein